MLNSKEENYQFLKNYDKFLTQFYGDYMTPPSVEEQQWYSHNIQAYKK